MDPYAAAWGPYIPALAAATAGSEQSFAYLHVAKTGGTTLRKALQADPRRLWVSLPFSFLPRVPCDCAEGVCLTHGLSPSLAGFGSPGFTATYATIKVPHERFDAIAWLREEIRAHGGRIDAWYLTCRPVRDRLVSLFTDYWTRVDLAARVRSDDLIMDAAEAVSLARYADDSRHYRQGSGPIDVAAWFTAFEEHGPGFPFFLDQILDGSPDRLAREVGEGRLSLLPATEIDGFITQATGRTQVPRHRESSVAHIPAVWEALDAALPMIDRLAERDRPFDRVIAELTGHDEFDR